MRDCLLYVLFDNQLYLLDFYRIVLIREATAMMEYTVQLDGENKIVSAIAKGKWDSETDNAMVQEIMGMVEANTILKVLLDIRELQFGHSVLQVFQRAQEMREKRKKVDTTSRKVAIVYSATLQVNMPFFETASQNRGLPYRVFTEMDEAKEWLLQTS